MLRFTGTVTDITLCLIYKCSYVPDVCKVCMCVEFLFLCRMHAVAVIFTSYHGVLLKEFHINMHNWTLYIPLYKVGFFVFVLYIVDYFPLLL